MEGSSNGTGNGDDVDPANLRSIADRAHEEGIDAANTEEEEDGQVAFVMEKGKRVTLSSLIRRGTPVSYTFKMEAKRVPQTGTGLIAFDDPFVMLVVDGRAGKVVIDPTFNDDDSVTKVEVEVNVKPRRIQDARSDAGRAMLGLEPVKETAAA